jgi:trehalose utilization protein
LDQRKNDLRWWHDRVHDGMDDRVHDGMDDRVHDGMDDRVHDGMHDGWKDWVHDEGHLYRRYRRNRWLLFGGSLWLVGL